MAEFLKSRNLQDLPGKYKIKSANAQQLHSRFKRLECPFTESADETWIVELLFKPGEPRIRVLQWLLSKFHRSVYNFLDPIYSSAEARMKAILHVASTLGLCRPTDLELIEGKVSMSKQMAFMDKLLNLVEIADSSENFNPQSPSKFTIRDTTSTEDQYSRDCALVDAIVQQQPVEQIFPVNITILPVDIKKSLERNSMSSNADREDRELPDIQKLTQKAMMVEEDLSRQCELHHQLKSEHTYTEVDRNARHTQLRKCKLILSELQQLMVNFNYCYENHIQPWCGREAPILSKLGDKITSVQRLLDNFATTVGAMKVIKMSHGRLEELSASLGSMVGSAETGDTQSRNEALDKLYQTLNSLEETLNASSAGHT